MYFTNFVKNEYLNLQNEKYMMKIYRYITTLLVPQSTLEHARKTASSQELKKKKRGEKGEEIKNNLLF